MGRKKQEDRTSFHARVNRDTPRQLRQLALLMGCKYGKGAAIGEFLDAIARSEIMLVPSNPHKVVDAYKSKG